MSQFSKVVSPNKKKKLSSGLRMLNETFQGPTTLGENHLEDGFTKQYNVSYI